MSEKHGESEEEGERGTIPPPDDIVTECRVQKITQTRRRLLYTFTHTTVHEQL